MSSYCRRSDFNNLCDPKSNSYLESLLVRYINFDESPHCGLVLKVTPPSYLNCPPLKPQLNGNFFLENFESDGDRLSLSANPPLPEGIAFSPFSLSLEGRYSGWKANRQSYTITASNPKGSASCSYTPAWMGKLPLKTNSTTCYDATAPTPVPDPSCSAIPGQDGQFQRGIAQSFSGPNTVAGVEITTDSTTGLIWTSCLRGETGVGCTPTGTTTFTLLSAQTECASLNSGSGYANRTDWRVPEIEEYISTYDYSLTNPSINQTYFPGTDAWNYKSNTLSGSAANAFYATIIESTIGANSVGDLHNLRCVSNSPPTTAKRLINNNDGTILDLDTSLVWQRCTAGQTNLSTCAGGTDLLSNWSGALGYCQNLNLAGKTWRLPNASEIRSLIDFYITYGSPGVDPIYFPNTAIAGGEYYWTSTTQLSTPANAFVAIFGSSSGGNDAKGNNTNRTRCVSDF
ncbi:PF07603 family protein [Leptospira wolbachii serovar Codice str. CDC]|uniref:PF07603 family protein n=1 Tax=Leptospira wolbachii serovar Codice str. CDC TaxID=1218599 RepID=R9A7M9_9LEPT|nr:PF07603 family protein [Leptospira wolbachii serovar Codice str. CDC]